MSSAQRDVAKFTRDKRPVSSHVNMRNRMGITSIQSAYSRPRKSKDTHTQLTQTAGEQTMTREEDEGTFVYNDMEQISIEHQ